MEIYILIISGFIFLSTVYVAINIQNKLNFKNICYSILSGFILSSVIYFLIEFLNSRQYDSAIKHSFFILSSFLIYITIKYSLIKNETLFLELFYGFKIDPNINIKKIILNFIAISFFSYSFLYFDHNNVFIYIIFFLLSLFLIFEHTMLEGIYKVIIILMAIFTGFLLNFDLIITTLLSLIIIQLFNLGILFLNTKHFEKIAYSNISNINYNFKFPTTYDFISRFEIKNYDLSILYYYNKKENVTYAIQLDLKEQLNSIIKNNNIKIFFMLFNSGTKKIEISFNDLKFYYLKGENYLTLNESNKIVIPEEIEDLDYFIQKKLNLKEILKY